MGCSELKPPIFKGCAKQIPGLMGIGKTVLLRYSRAVFDLQGNFIGTGQWDGKTLKVENFGNDLNFTVQEYAFCANKSESNVTKHIREGKSLPFVIKAEKSPYYNRYILTVSPSIKLKQPLK